LHQRVAINKVSTVSESAYCHQTSSQRTIYDYTLDTIPIPHQQQRKLLRRGRAALGGLQRGVEQRERERGWQLAQRRSEQRGKAAAEVGNVPSRERRS